MARLVSSAIAGLLLAPMPSLALPGESVEEVANWIYTNPLLPDGRRGSLRVSRSDIPGQRLTFVASKTLPTERGLGVGETRIRSEWIEILDYRNGVTSDRLVEALRGIYGLDLYQDYRNAELVHDYTVPVSEEGTTVRRGQLWRGDRFGYWLEITEQDGEDPVLGQLSLMLVEDIATVQADL
ncbi:MAG: hypothetical protein ACLFM4_16545 [Phormidium sp.]